LTLAANVPTAVVQSLWVHRSLISQLVRREVVGRYAGSFLGIVWSFINPLLMLTIYTFVFGVVFKSRWRAASTDPLEFAVVMFGGLIIHALVAECLQRAPTLIVGNANLVKKIVFPLETLAWVSVGTALFHFLIALLIFAGALFVWQGAISWSFLLVPVLVSPLALMTVGLVWIVSSLGVYLRDIGQLMGIVTALLMFLAPVFYPLHSVPAGFAHYLYLNPITFILEQVRNAAIWGEPVNWLGWAMYWVVAYAVAWLGWTWFARVRKGFADVL
jgi:lipopolysaccharide transport system permease protein